MQQRDILQQQIEQITRVLAKIAADFLGLKNQGMLSESIKLTNEQFNAKESANNKLQISG